MNSNQISEAIEISYKDFWQKTCMICLGDMNVNNFDRKANVIKITFEPDLMEWLDELNDRINEIGSGWIEKEEIEEPEEFFWWVEILESISEQIERERRRLKNQPKLLLSRKQLLALQTALYQYAQNANVFISEIDNDDKVRNLYVKDLKNVGYVMGIITRELHHSVKDECKFCSRNDKVRTRPKGRGDDSMIL